jgi:hypothetical protein
MRVAIVDLGDVPTELRRTVARIMPDGWCFTEVLLPHRDAGSVRQWAYPMLVSMLRSHSFHVRWFGSYGLVPELRQKRDCADALQSIGIDEFDDFDDAFTSRTGTSTDRATITRALENAHIIRTPRDAIFVRLRGCEDVRFVQSNDDSEEKVCEQIRDDVLDPHSTCHRIRRLQESRKHASSRASRSELCRCAQECIAKLVGPFRQLIEGLSADRLLVYASGTVSLGAHNGTDCDPWDMAVPVCIAEKGSFHNHTTLSPVSLDEIFRIFNEGIGRLERLPSRPMLTDELIVSHGTNFRHIILVCRSVRMRIFQWVPYLFDATHLQVFKHVTDPMCEDDLTLHPGWLASSFAQTLAAMLVTITDRPLRNVAVALRTSTEFRTLARMRCVYSVDGMVPLSVLRSCAEKGVVLTDNSSTHELNLSIKRGEVLIDDKWRLTGHTEVDSLHLIMRHRVVPVHPTGKSDNTR